MNSRLIKPVPMAAALLLSVVIILVLFPEEDTALPDLESVALPVTVVDAAPRSAQIQLQVTGITSARWPVTVQAMVAGKVEYLDPTLEPGSLLAAQQPLLRLDPVHLLAEQEQSRSRVANAQLALARERHEQTVALTQLSKRKSTPFARHELQIAAANAELISAQQAFSSASQRVSDAQIQSPFTAIVLERSVTPGQQIQVGDSLFKLAASDSLDVQVPLSEQLWQRLGNQLPQQLIEVSDRQNHRWPASVRYLAPGFDSLTRQRLLVLTVANPYAKKTNNGQRLLPDQQVNVQIVLPPQKHVVMLPPSVLTQDGQVWSVSSNNTLQLEEVTLLQQQENLVWLQFVVNAQTPRRIVSYPLLSMLEGQKITPREDSVERNTELWQ